MAKYRLELPPGRFGTIYADPPWRSRIGGAIRKLRYDTMSLDEIKAIPVASVCLPYAHLWLWTTNPHLPEALEVVRAWGFEYKTLRTWVKPKMGLGWWLRSKTEHIIFAVRSNERRIEPGRYTTVFEAPWNGHSIKPAEMYEVIEALSPPPFLELFARAGPPRRQWTYLVSDAPPVGDPYGTGGD